MRCLFLSSLCFALALCGGCTSDQNSVIDTTDAEVQDETAYDTEMIELARGQAE